MRRGVRLAVDVGKARIGVARSDPHGMLALPVETVRRDAAGGADVERIAVLAADVEAVEVYVGLPINLQGRRTASTDDAERFSVLLAARLDAPVRLVDERLSTVSAQGHLRQAGKTSKQSRDIIDQAAAVVILQQALDMERTLGGSPGRLVEKEVDAS